MAKEFKCVVCGRCHLKSRRKITTKALKQFVRKRIERNLEENDVICEKCRSIYRKTLKKVNNEQKVSNCLSECITDDSDSEFVINTEEAVSTKILSPKQIELNISSTHTSHRFCIVCKKEGTSRNKLCKVPLQARTQAFIKNAVFIDGNTRCCKHHLSEQLFDDTSLQALTAKYTTTYMNRSDITSLLENVRKTLATSHILNFDNPLSLSDGDYYNLTGLSKQQFNELSSYIVSARQTNVRSVRTCIAVLLTKLRTGLPNHILGTIFSLTKSQVQRCIHSARVSLMQDFVPHFIGFQHISHEDFVRNHTTPIAKTLFANDSEDAAIIVMDGTYIYLQKSADYEFQRLSYSLHKNRPLVKPMVIVGTDGYILSVLGPYFANGKNNDAAITKHMISVNAEGMNEWLETSDVCVVDRGFRDVVDFLREQGYNVEMPVYLKKGSKQHPVEEANASRLVTKVRWVVESVNARVKQWRFFDKVVSNHFIPIIGDLLRIVCAVCNKFRPPLAGTHPEDKSIAEAMLEKCKKGNAIQKMVTEEGLLTKRTIYKLVDASNVLDELADFPVLSMDKLREITMGVYQLKQAPNYVREHEGEDGKFELYVCKIKANLLKIKIQSRHSNKLSHTVFTSYSDEGDIEGWYCTCKSGARVVGCCAHVASVLWYLGYQRLEQQSGSRRDFKTSVLDASHIRSSDESDCDSLPEE
ncbi:uncharacterized protein LOC143052466 [Mytilus galloprovincialis]|uniref:uncharacterized protein LOC143052466 n=1 Tax=Mytilus galloprovincialis TaxID=29158 RepID=UPI003F7C4738